MFYTLVTTEKIGSQLVAGFTRIGQDAGGRTSLDADAFDSYTPEMKKRSPSSQDDPPESTAQKPAEVSIAQGPAQPVSSESTTSPAADIVRGDAVVPGPDQTSSTDVSKSPGDVHADATTTITPPQEPMVTDSTKHPGEVIAYQSSKEGTGDDSTARYSVKDPAAVALGRKGGEKGGPARAKRLSKEELSNIARKAAIARWSKKKGSG